MGVHFVCRTHTLGNTKHYRVCCLLGCQTNSHNGTHILRIIRVAWVSSQFIWSLLALYPQKCTLGGRCVLKCHVI